LYVLSFNSRGFAFVYFMIIYWGF